MAIIDKAMSLHYLCKRTEYELLARAAMLAPLDGHFVELGAFQGASTAVIANVANGRRQPFVTIDNFKLQTSAASPERLAGNLTKLGIDPLPRIVKGQSHVVPTGVDEVAFLFIDTVHKAEVLNPELDAWLPLIVPGGVIALHDYNWPDRFPEMIEVIDERLADDPGWQQIGLEVHMVAFVRVDA